MHCYRVLSIFVFLFLFISLGAALVSLWSANWWVGEFETLVPLKESDKNISLPADSNLHWLFAVRYGLTQQCWRSKQPRRIQDPDNYQIIPDMQHCVSHDIKLLGDTDISMRHFRNILICMAVGIIFNVLAFIFAFFNLPCIRRLKKCLMLLTIIMSVIAAIAILVGLFIANDTLFYEAKFMKKMRANKPDFGDNVTPKAASYLNDVFEEVNENVYSKVFEEVFQKGWSFIVGCVAEVFLLLAIIFAIIENCCYQRAPGKEYLLDDDDLKSKM